MSHSELNNFQASTFLQQYWQQKPLLLENALPDFISPIDANELAGLALEDEVESRLIVEDKTAAESAWQVRHGPFDESEYSSLQGKNWTLLVQAVDLYIDEIAELKQYFRFIPDWRIDDIMISFAPKGGSVGPHFDQYDVFLLQASGSREWKIGQFCDKDTELQENEQLKILSQFDTQQTHTLNAGDILYVPPGVAHWGVSQSDDCMTISIGFRAPSSSQIIQNCCDEVVSRLSDDQRFNDIQIDSEAHPGQIPHHVKQQIKDILLDNLVNSKALMNSFGQMMTDCKYSQMIDETKPSLSEAKEQQLILEKSPDARLAYFIEENEILLFANGHTISCPLNEEDFLQSLSDNCIDINHDTLNDKQTEIINSLIKLGVYDSYDESYYD